MDSHYAPDFADHDDCKHRRHPPLPQLCCNHCAPLPCSCANRRGGHIPSRWEGGCTNRTDPTPDCSDLNFLIRSAGRNTQHISAGKEGCIQFDTPESGTACGNGITYHQGMFYVCEPGLYHFDISVCFVAPNLTEDEQAAAGSSVAIGVVPLASGFSERYVYARVPGRAASTIEAASNLSVTMSGDLYVCGQQILKFVAKSLDSRDIKIRSTRMNPDASVCTWVSIRQVCRDCNPCPCH